MENILAAQNEVIEYGRELLHRGLVAGTWGNISTRIRGSKFIAITPSGRDYRTLAPSDIVVLDEAGSIVRGQLKPSTELPLHLAIYNARPDVAAIVHTHSVFASACAVAQKEIPPIIEDLVQVIGGAVTVAEYALPGTPELAGNTVKSLADKNGVLLANHGVIGCGRSLGEALTACELIEKAARIYIYSFSLGGPCILSDSDVAVMHKYYVEHYRRQEDANE